MNLMGSWIYILRIITFKVGLFSINIEKLVKIVCICDLSPYICIARLIYIWFKNPPAYSLEDFFLFDISLQNIKHKKMPAVFTTGIC
jgi:hypothetical protein